MIARGVHQPARRAHFVQGGSTLTQQLAKNLYLTSDRTFARKLEEVVLALWLEARLTKSDILELYLNRVYFGGGAYGIDAAARRYFGKPARKLTLAEAALHRRAAEGALEVFAAPPTPSRARAGDASCWRRCVDAGFISADEEREASAQMSGIAAGEPERGRGCRLRHRLRARAACPAREAAYRQRRDHRRDDARRAAAGARLRDRRAQHRRARADACGEPSRGSLCSIRVAPSARSSAGAPTRRASSTAR